MNCNTIKQAIIFAAGKGTRMAPLTQFLPKPLIVVNKEPMIERNIKFLQQCNIKKIYIVVGYLKEQFNYLKNLYNVELIENLDYDQYNNISSLNCSINHWDNTLYVEGDLYLKENIFIEIKKAIESNDCSVAFSRKFEYHQKEWAYFLDHQQNVINHQLVNDAYGLNVWSGILFINEKTSKEIVSKFKDFYVQENNKQKYFEQFLWTLENKFKHLQISRNQIEEIDNFEDLLKIDKSYQNQSKTILFTPGPVNVYQEVNDILADCVIHHRSELYSSYLEETTELVKEFFKTKEGLPLFLTASATGAMESLVVNLVNKNDQILLIECGDFGKRFGLMIEPLLKEKNQLNTLSFLEGNSYDEKIVEKSLKEKQYNCVFITHHETSTGVLNDIKMISDLIQKYQKDCLFIVDTVSSFICEDILFDEWKLDATIGTSGKGLCLMPGLSFVVLSQKAIKKVRSNDNYKFYFDLNKYIDMYEQKRSCPFTPATSIMLAVNASMKIIKNQTIESINLKRKNIYEYLHNMLTDLGFKSCLKKELKTIGLLVLDGPEGYDMERLRNLVYYKYNIFFELGRLNRRKNQVRIGISNIIKIEDATALYEAIKDNLSLCKVK